MEPEHRKRYLSDALSYAVDIGSIESAKALISVGADVNHSCNDRGHSLAFDAVSRHRTEILQMLLEAGTVVDMFGKSSGDEYETLLCLACARGFTDMVKLLLQFKADVNGSEDTSALHMTSLHGHAGIAKILLENDAQIEYLDCYRRTPLYCAFISNSVEVARLLVAHGANINFEYRRNAFLNTNTEKLLTVASNANNTELIDLLLENGYPITVWTESDEDSEMDTETDFTDEDDELRGDLATGHFCRQKFNPGDVSKTHCEDTDVHNLYMYFDGKWDVTRHFMVKDIHFCQVPRLHRIFLKGDMNEIMTLFEDASLQASDMRRLDRTRKSVFHYAFASGSPEVVEKCLSLAALLGIRSFGFKPLFFAAKHGYVEIVESLLKQGLPLHKGDSTTQQTPLHIACCYGHNAVIRKLVEFGADVNAVDNDGQNSLHIVTENGNIEMVKFLLENGAQICRKNCYSWTVIHQVANANHVEIMELLLNISPGLVNVTGQYQKETPLHVACFHGEFEAAVSLIKHGADIGALDYKGNTPLHLACTGHNPELVCLLIQQGAEMNIANDDGWTPLVCALDKYCEYPDEFDFNVPRIMMILLDHGGSIYPSSDASRGELNRMNPRISLGKLYKKNLFIFVTFMQFSGGILSDIVVDVSEMISRHDLDSIRLVWDCGHHLYIPRSTLMDPETEEITEQCKAIQNSPVHLYMLCIYQIRRMLRLHQGSLIKLIDILPIPPGLATILTFPNTLHVCNMAPVAKLLLHMCSGRLESI